MKIQIPTVVLAVTALMLAICVDTVALANPPSANDAKKAIRSIIVIEKQLSRILDGKLLERGRDNVYRVTAKSTHKLSQLQGMEDYAFIFETVGSMLSLHEGRIAHAILQATRSEFESAFIKDTPPVAPSPNDEAGSLSVRLSGGIGTDIDSGFVALCADYAKDNGVGEFVIVLDTPGGYVHIAEDIADAMNANDTITWKVKCDNVISAGIWIAFTADELCFTKESVIGGALAYKRDDTGNYEVSNKFNSITAAELVKLSSDPNMAAVIRSMTMSDAELWANTDSSPVMFQSSKPVSSSAQNYRRIDVPGSVLTLSGIEAIELGLGSHCPSGNMKSLMRIEVLASLRANLRPITSTLIPHYRARERAGFKRRVAVGYGAAVEELTKLCTVIESTANLFPSVVNFANEYDRLKLQISTAAASAAWEILEKEVVRYSAYYDSKIDLRGHIAEEPFYQARALSHPGKAP